MGKAAATIRELRATCIGADAEFLLSQLEAGATVDQAKAAWIDELLARREAAGQALADAQMRADDAERALRFRYSRN